MPTLLTPYLLPLIAMINVLPDPVAFQLGPIPVYWYGIGYAVGLAATYIVITREARRRGLDARLVDNGIILVAVAALIGGRLYHVIDQWQLYKDDPLKIVLPPYTGLGVFGGIITGTIAVFLFTRWKKQSFWKWADVIAPGLFVMQAIGRVGNFFNQELYGPPTDLPWGIAIDCAHRTVDYPCTTFPVETTGFHPLFLYESVSGILGAITLLWIARRWGPKMRPGDLFLMWVIWYSVVRFALETLRSQNWTVGGIPTAMIVSTVLVVISVAILLWRHRPSVAAGDRWGEPPGRIADADVVEEIEVDDAVEVDEVPAGGVEAHDDPAPIEPASEPEAVADDHAPVEGGLTAAADAASDDDDGEIVDDDDAAPDIRRGGA
ncbi:MAG TPA: prolipoprotein diacylglyceryl transferase [Candidatus Limnocylindrales bacterium]|nr:prolipoprotein diacylglyceryl transferase [Candidatus Limnocylindrales bacterium]